jgi:hypothetical protein
MQFVNTPSRSPYFYPGQEPVTAHEFAGLRRQYVQTVGPMAKAKLPPRHINHYYSPKDSSTRLNELKARAVGKSIASDTYSTKSYTPSATRSSLRRLRGAGSVAPAKKGAV